MLESEIFNAINSIKPKTYLKCYMRTMYFIEQGIKEILNFSQK